MHLLETLELPEQEYPARVNYSLIAPELILHLGESLEEKEEIMELLLRVFAGNVLYRDTCGFWDWVGHSKKSRERH